MSGNGFRQNKWDRKPMGTVMVKKSPRGSSYDTWAHVGDGGAVRDGQGSDALAKELNELPNDADLKCEEQLPLTCLSRA